MKSKFEKIFNEATNQQNFVKKQTKLTKNPDTSYDTLVNANKNLKESLQVLNQLVLKGNYARSETTSIKSQMRDCKIPANIE